MAKTSELYTVLTIEDEPDIQSFIARVMELEGYRVLKAANGEAGLALLKENPIDLVLLDLRMPGQDGWSVLRTMKRTRALSKIPIVVVTALAEEAQRQHTLSMGATCYLTKPLSTQSLMRTISEIRHKKVSRYPAAKAYAASHA